MNDPIPRPSPHPSYGRSDPDLDERLRRQAAQRMRRAPRDEIRAFSKIAGWEWRAAEARARYNELFPGEDV